VVRPIWLFCPTPFKALLRDLDDLAGGGAIAAKSLPYKTGFLISTNLDWPTQITGTEFFQRVKTVSKGEVCGFRAA
jgi:hypothetical protein